MLGSHKCLSSFIVEDPQCVVIEGPRYDHMEEDEVTTCQVYKMSEDTVICEVNQIKDQVFLHHMCLWNLQLTNDIGSLSTDKEHYCTLDEDNTLQHNVQNKLYLCNKFLH